MKEKLLFNLCFIGIAVLVGGCSGTGKSTENDSVVISQETSDVEYIRLNCAYNVGEDHSLDAKELARQLIAASQNDDGEIDYDMYESATYPGKFIIYETWKDQSSLDVHSASDHFTTLVPKMQEIAPLTVEAFEKVEDPVSEGKNIRINCMFVAKEGQEDALLNTAKELVAASQSDEGVIEYDIYSSVTRPGYFMIFETWDNQSSLDAHSAASHFTTLVPRLKELSESTATDIFFY